MMYKCCGCGKLFHEGQIKIVSEPRGYYNSMPCYENREVSPCCGDDFTAVATDDEFTEEEE